MEISGTTERWKGRRVLVTGATGFIGGRLARALVEEGAYVVALTHNVPDPFEPKGITVEFGDVTDFNKMRSIISAHEIDTVFHLASYAIVRIAAKDPMTTYSVNVMGTVSLLEACRSVGSVRKIIVASSDKAYGDHEKLPYVEDFALKPKNTYDTSKACMDLISRSYAHNYGMPIVVTRSSNVYGPGDRNFSRLIPNTIRRLIAKQSPMIYEDVHDMWREFIYIDDVVEAYLLLGLSGNETDGKAYNIGGTGQVHIGELVGFIVKMMYPDAPDNEFKPIVAKRDLNFKEIKEQWIDASALEKAVGWTPTVSLGEGLRRSINWYREIR